MHSMLRCNRNEQVVTAMDDRLLDILACPVCKGPLKFRKAAQVLVCRAERLSFPLRDGVPSIK